MNLKKLLAARREAVSKRSGHLETGHQGESTDQLHGTILKGR
jgi:hypothetical protein